MNRSLLCRLVLVVFIALVGVPYRLAAQSDSFNAGSNAEWDRAEWALVHTPGEELFYGVLHPEAALFERPFSSTLASQEHERFVRQLREQGISVVQLREAVLAGTVDQNGREIPGPALDELRRFAFRFVTLESEPPVSESQQDELEKSYFAESFQHLHPDELWSTIVLNPKITLRSTGDLNTGVVADYAVRPVMNLYFMRDQVITTRRGVVVGKMNSEQRHIETDIVRFALGRMGIKPIGVIEEPGRLEGGDFLPAGDRVFIGEGLRTNAAAILQLLVADAFGTDEVVVVKDPWQQQEQMHLDTYFNLVADDLALLAENRLGESKHVPTVDVFKKDGDGYELQSSGMKFPDYLKSIGIRVIPVKQQDQLNYGCNVLTLKSNEIFVVDGVSDEFLAKLRDADVTVNVVDFSNLTGGYGACHCTVQVLSRKQNVDGR
ncbi:Arginine deiminase [Thalassoglobus neptunius]|uniref:arginine deiminase n=1 Tax=Thalassoglobus neptunius TaxID=1938619 RepID=A0A5C5UYA4_9PLAN|nr:arginine deiminase family protein [Thalassoglobus neptunius]TWT31336.1 Arginine deiminase [Thalassoglobus neptunius]